MFVKYEILRKLGIKFEKHELTLGIETEINKEIRLSLAKRISSVE